MVSHGEGLGGGVGGRGGGVGKGVGGRVLNEVERYWRRAASCDVIVGMWACLGPGGGLGGHGSVLTLRLCLQLRRGTP